MSQKSLFPTNNPKLPPGVVLCTRCSKRCRAAEKVNPTATLFVKGTAKTGRYCAECLIVDFLRNCDTGPASALGMHFFDPSLPQPEYQKERREKDRRFDPESLRFPHVQAHMTAIIVAAQRQYGGELTPEEIDWDEVIANWHLPFPQKKRKRRHDETR
jgi:hypothetical protein